MTYRERIAKQWLDIWGDSKGLDGKAFRKMSRDRCQALQEVFVVDPAPIEVDSVLVRLDGFGNLTSSPLIGKAATQ